MTSFSTLYFSYVGRPRNFIGQSTRVIHRRKWRERGGRWGGGGGLDRPGEADSCFSNQNAQLHGAKNRTATCTAWTKPTRCLKKILRRSTHCNRYLKKCADDYLRHCALSFCPTAGHVFKRAMSLVKFKKCNSKYKQELQNMSLIFFWFWTFSNSIFLDTANWFTGNKL